MKPLPPRSIQPPNPLCPLCGQQRACPFHAARSPKELGEAFFAALRKKGTLALVDFLTWALCNVEAMVPDAMVNMLGELDRDEIEQEFAKLLDQEGFDTDDLRRLAAVCMASALITEQQEQEQDGPNDAAQERQHPHDRSRGSR